MLIWVASFPRSGSNLTMVTLRRAFRFAKGTAEHPDRTLRQRFGLAGAADLFAALDGLGEPVFVKTHALPDGGPEAAGVYLVRDGRDAAVSLAHFVIDRRHRAFAGASFEKALERIIRYGPRHGLDPVPGQVPPEVNWSDHVRWWTDRSEATVMVRFEALIEDPASVVGEAVRSLGIEVPKQRKSIPGFAELHERDPVMYRAGRVGGWSEEMPANLQELFWDLHGSRMEVLGYRREPPRDARGGSGSARGAFASVAAVPRPGSERARDGEPPIA